MNEQIEYWNGAAGERWVHEQEALDAMLRPFGDAALDAARPTQGEAVVVGCGCGDTSIALASRVGGGGRVVGVDVSAPMLARARERSAAHPTLSFVEGDASSQPLADGAFDLLFSRFGVMFFLDPAQAFGRLRGALRATGRVAFVCWKPLADNPWAVVPFEAAASVLGRPEPAAADAPGPFAFGDAARVRRVLGDAGFVEVNVRPFETIIAFGESGSLGDVVDQMVRLGPVARLLADRDEAAIGRARSAIRAALHTYRTPRGLVDLRAAAWVVTARTADRHGVAITDQ